MSEPNVNVAIMNAKKIDFELYGNYKIGKSDFRFSGQCNAEYKNGGIIIQCYEKQLTFDNVVQIKASDLRSDSFLLHNVMIGKEFHWQKNEKQRFIGSLKFIIEKNELVAINTLPVEDYLMSVISSEMSAGSSLNFLKAHAIISRSWLITQVEGRKTLAVSSSQSGMMNNDDEIIKWYDREDHKNYDVCADDHCQRYQGITKVYTDAAKSAIEETRGLVLMYNNKICDARYSKCCGGMTEAFENVWGNVEHQYLAGKIDYRFEPDDFDLNLKNENYAVKWITNKPAAFCNTNDKKLLSEVLVDFDKKTTDFYRWKVSYTQAELQKIITEKSGLDFGNIIDLVPLERGVSGRIVKLKIIGTERSVTVGKELEIRKWLSTSHLYSSAFIVRKEKVEEDVPQRFILLGAGWGHGVGLCQIGAAAMSSLGYAFDEILAHYFKDSVIRKIYK